MLTVDDRCTMTGCEHKGVYRMVGKCSNCHTEDILVLFTAGHDTRNADCPVCGVAGRVMPLRLATEDEIPAAEPFPR